MTDEILSAALQLADLKLLLLMLLGAAVGMIGGGLPGISASITIALLLPFAFTLEPLQGLVVLGAIYMAAEYGGSISAILINTPGTAAAVCTAIDGYPMAKQGRAKEALDTAVISSCIGGVIGAIILIFFTPPLARFALKFGSPEMFWLAIAGLAMVCNLTAKNFTKGVVATLIGLSISAVGLDEQTGHQRFTFDIPHFYSGIALVPCVIGFFAVPEMFAAISKPGRTGNTAPSRPASFASTAGFILRRPLLVLQSSVIGTLVGILPGAGASIASFIAYSEAKRFAKAPDKLGTGNPEGIIASECANNSMVGGSLVPLLAFGIPGSASAAILFGALTLNGLVPGPRLFQEHAGLVYSFMFSFFPICLFMLIVGGLFAPGLALILRTRKAFIVPTVLFLVLIGTYANHNSMIDVAVAAACGVLGILLARGGFPLPPIVLGIILGPMAEEGFRRSLQLGQIEGSVWMMFFGRPISAVLILITCAMVFSAFWREARNKKQAASHDEVEE
ncbi:tripartite tricarboxylate transporter permease [Albidovulum sediminicola]|uniref:Tripartite tricarboxylate transporter permease n=1 Tax=Albidovulum sediminicola TaxID=2984331 RepID=A0ABT2Z6E3_9RHOB|nr:tripartite tricarboxylate transporter permease [Defluviimonas sp. WL0075]MCV2866708.1 tripartite tricarboxylate transporter permease [Defluviimonas sp. WL0075]